jgi:tRNA pseudouridine32 synthase/23S rRNA pseudouridine746 synthase
MNKKILKTVVHSDAQETACDFLAFRTGLSKSRIKDAMNKGAVWIRKKKGGTTRLRRATTRLIRNDLIEIYYDENILSVEPPEAKCLDDRGHYSIWYKPQGLLAQGSKYGDHCSLLRQAELQAGSSKEVYLVHRLDREASGLILLAHSREAAAKLSALFQKNLISKTYLAEVAGDLRERGVRGSIDLSLDGKTAHTDYEVLSYDRARDVSSVSITISTGRLHQIRRHLEMIGHPVMGDPKYGSGNKNREGLKLVASGLGFPCPFAGKDVFFTLGKDSNQEVMLREGETGQDE